MSTQDTRTAAEKRYDAVKDGSLYVKASASADAVWNQILDIIADPTNDGRPPFNPATYDYDKNIAVLERLEAAIGIPPELDEARGRMFDQETADALDIFTSWWRKARQDRA